MPASRSAPTCRSRNAEQRSLNAVTIVDGTLAWREHPDPEPGTGELLVAVRSAGLNSADLMQRQGFYPAPPGSPPDIPGLEFAGEVVAVGPNVTRFAVGDRVMSIVGGGAQAELCLVHERVAMPVPAGVDLIAAGGFPEAFLTAHDALFTQCGLRMGERLCVHGAAGGVGLAAVQLGALAGARVTATVRSEMLRDAVAALGATNVVDPSQFVEHGPFDVVLELIGAPNFRADMDSLATGGRIAIIGVGAGASVELDLLALMRTRGRIHGSTLRTRPLEEKALVSRRVETEVLPALEAARITIPVESTFAMADAGTAYERFAAGGKLGKILLTT